MKTKKSLLFLALFPLLLSSCSSQAYYGTYSFEMGASSEEAHMGIYLDLTNQKHSVTIAGMTFEGEYFKIKLDAPQMGGMLGFDTIEGSYSVDDSTVDSPRIHLNPSISIIEQEIPIPSETVDLIMLAYYKVSTVNVIIPVSIDDLVFQLYWYGYDLTGGDSPSKHDLGTHPTAEEVKSINDGGYKDRHSDTEFRDYYTLNMGLKKE